MKRIICSLCFVTVTVLTALFCVNTILEKKSSLSKVMLNENIEALTKGESLPCLFRVFPCYTSYGTECVYSQDEYHAVCCYSSYCN